MPKNPRKERPRLELNQAVAVLGSESQVRILASSRQAFQQWKGSKKVPGRGVPWELVGPILLERLSQSLGAHTQDSRQGDDRLHKIMDIQGRVFLLARKYGVDSKEMRALEGFLDSFVPQDTHIDNPRLSNGKSPMRAKRII